MAGELFSLQGRRQDGARRLSRRGAGDQRPSRRPVTFDLREPLRSHRQRQGRSLRALAVTSAQRAATAPEIPSVAEVALPGFDAATWFALVAPAGTAREIVLRLNAEVTRLVAQPDTRKRFSDLGMTIGPGPADALDAYIKSEIGKWSQGDQGGRYPGTGIAPARGHFLLASNPVITGPTGDRARR
jgi:hypothetical protein